MAGSAAERGGEARWLLRREIKGRWRLSWAMAAAVLWWKMRRVTGRPAGSPGGVGEGVLDGAWPVSRLGAATVEWFVCLELVRQLPVVAVPGMVRLEIDGSRLRALGCAGGGRWAACSCLCGSVMDRNVPATTTRCRCGGDVIQLGRCCPNPVGRVGDVRCYGRKSCRLRSVPVATAPVGVVPLLGGVTEVCRRLPPRIGVWLLSPGESLGSAPNRRWRRYRRHSSVGSIVFGDTARRSYVAIIWCLLLPQVELQGRYVRHRWCTQDDALLETDQVPPPTRHPVLGNHGWMVH